MLSIMWKDTRKKYQMGMPPANQIHIKLATAALVKIECNEANLPGP